MNFSGVILAAAGKEFGLHVKIKIRAHRVGAVRMAVAPLQHMRIRLCQSRVQRFF